MEVMTSRERIKAAAGHRPPDRLPVGESFWDDTPAAWRAQGLPAGVDLADHFGYDLCHMFLDASPRFEQKLLRREGDYILYEDRFGYTVRKLENRSCTMDFQAHKTADRAAWEQARKRFVLSDDPAEPARIDSASYFAHFDPYPTWEGAARRYARARASGRYLLFLSYGPWEATWRHRGYLNQLTDVLTDPDWVREMADVSQDLVIAILRRCLKLGMRPDGYYLIEDLGCNRGPLISPQTWRRVFRPSVERLGAFLRANDIDFWMHCCGNIEPLFDDLIECGLQVMNPLQWSAGLDVRVLRPKYGRRLAFYGNVPVPKMMGPLEELEREVRSRAVLARDGGYILHSDHSIPPNVTLERYRWMLATARDAFERGDGGPTERAPK